MKWMLQSQPTILHEKIFFAKAPSSKTSPFPRILKGISRKVIISYNLTKFINNAGMRFNIEQSCEGENKYFASSSHYLSFSNYDVKFFDFSEIIAQKINIEEKKQFVWWYRHEKQ